MSLFEFDSNEKEILLDGRLVYWPNFFPPDLAQRYFEILLKETPWRQEEITIFGKTMPMPRLMAWYGDAGADTSYSRRHFTLHPWTETLRQLRKAAEDLSGKTFESVLLNLYRNGQDSVGWHADTEEGSGPEPTIVSLSFGAERRFQLREIGGKGKGELELRPGSALMMQGDMQQRWQHQISKTRREVGPRINLTFRKRS